MGDGYDNLTVGDRATHRWLEKNRIIDNFHSFDKLYHINLIGKLSDYPDTIRKEADDLPTALLFEMVDPVNVTDKALDINIQNYGFNSSVFGDLISASRVAQATGKFDFGIDSEQISLKEQENTANFSIKGNVGHENRLAIFSGETAESLIRIEDSEYLRYIPGYEFGAWFTAYFKSLPTIDGKIELGLMDANDGFGIGYKMHGGSMKFGMIIRSGGAENFIPQSEFNLDKADGSGKSGFVLNLSAGNIFRIKAGYLGYATPTLFILDKNNKPIALHAQQHPNVNDGSTIIARTALAVSGYVSNGTTAENVEVQIGSYNAFVVDGESAGVQDRSFYKSQDLPGVTAGTDKLLLAFKNKENAQLFGMPSAKDNRIAAALKSLNMRFGASSQGGQLQLVIIPTSDVSGGIFADINTQRSIMETSLNATFVLTNATELFTFDIPKVGYDLPTIAEVQRKLRPGETALFLWTSTSPTIDITFSNSWSELH